jgi:3-oxoacyl-[acyl-carrier protein] reductase
MIAVHLRGTFLCNRRAIGPVLAAGEGVIINLSSNLGQIGGMISATTAPPRPASLA